MPLLTNPYFSQKLYHMLNVKFSFQWANHDEREEQDIGEVLYTVFGEKRVHNAVAKLKLHVDLNVISPTDLRRLFAKLALIKLEDLSLLYQEIMEMKEDSSIRGIDLEQSQEIKALFSQEPAQKFSDLDKNKLDILMHILLPFKELDDIFLKEPPRVRADAPDSGQSEKGKTELAYILNLLRFEENLDSKKRQIYYAKRISDREPKNDIIIPHENGYYHVFDHVSEGSVYATLLKPVSSANENFIPMVLFRGTRVNFSATRSLATAIAALKDAQATYTFPEFLTKFKPFVSPSAYYLPNSRYRKCAGFVDDNEKFAVCGMSLGGGHAALTAVYYPARVSLVELTAPIGLLNPELGSYAEDIKTLAKEETYIPPKFVRIIDEKDTVTHLGSGHLGHGCLNHLDYNLICAVSEETERQQRAHPQRFWQNHSNNRQTNLPEFMLHSRMGGLISLLQGLCGQHTQNPYENSTNPAFFSLSNNEEERSLKEEDLNHSHDARYYVELGRRSSKQLISGGFSALFALVALGSIITLSALLLAGLITAPLSTIGVGLIITASVFLSLTIVTAAMAIAASPEKPERESQIEYSLQVMPDQR